jgi:mannose-1-phosphate guanylyltransferase
MHLCKMRDSDFTESNFLVERRPWGHFERFTLNEPSTVKLVYVESGQRLSLQYHNHRTEFWKVVKGPIKVRIGDEHRILQTDDSVIVPDRTVHRLIGLRGVQQAIILEISFGEFDESDIVRLEDDYSRQMNKATSEAQ